MDSAHSWVTGVEEILIFDSSTFIKEIGLMSHGGSALKHYIHSRGMRLVVPEVVAEECERNLTKHAITKKKEIQSRLQWLGRFYGGMSGWSAPSDEEIVARAKALASAQDLGAVVLPEPEEVRKRAKYRNKVERPPSHKSAQLNDCRIWEQCLALLAYHNVVFISVDKDFVGHRKSEELHPQLRVEADGVHGGRTLQFHRSMKLLLRELESEISAIPDDAIFEFVYSEITSVIEELASNSGCRPKATGQVRQTRLTTEQANIIEIRLEVEDIWESDDGATTLNFQLSGSCRYLLAEKQLTELTAREVSLLETQPDGSKLAVQGSYVSVEAHMFAGAPPIKPEQSRLG